MQAFLKDSGPVVALLNLRDEYHRWARDQFDHASCPILTCGEVVTEPAYLLWADGLPAWGVLQLIERGMITVQFDLETKLDRVLALMQKYSDTPMDFVDACLVAMTEAKRNCCLITLDSDFKIYRRFERHAIPLISPRD